MEGNKFGGERLESKSELSRNNLVEHLARYELVVGDPQKTVLDIGCGSGHGSSCLSKKFKKVYGVDVSAEAVRYAKENWQEDNIDFVVGSATAIPFPDSTFDTAVAMEVFEHIEHWEDFLLELRRVVKKDGEIYISTPNKDIYSPGTAKPINPHHFFEMTEPEFRKAIGDKFEIKKFFGQRTPIYNDHWIWKVVNPFLRTFRSIISYKLNNAIKLRTINWIKPELSLSDIVFFEEEPMIRKSRFFVILCLNRK
jgi:ubiquinone/menaquinone biosynthesis C-methylase UbiE